MRQFTVGTCSGSVPVTADEFLPETYVTDHGALTEVTFYRGGARVAYFRDPVSVSEAVGVTGSGAAAERFHAGSAPDGTVVKISDHAAGVPGWIFEKDTDAWYTPQVEDEYSDRDVQGYAEDYGCTVLWPVTA